ncbi:FAD/NAD(P)-binding protein [Streptomyces sp. NPDC088745]|uniref:FAD/NAD(P)-binding protein n=1 Tax=Streptomyces sp. NPDC088745 TaxID=3365884 RepID=UPI003825A980
MSVRRLTVCIVGAGPRGLSVLERLCAHERKSASHPAVTVHVVDPARPGAGRVWRTGQPRQLLMNTVASQVTVFTDGSVDMAGPVEAGPSLHEWARELAALSPVEELLGGHDDATLAEARALGADSYPTRAFYGCYLEEMFRRVVCGAPAHLEVRVHRSTAVSLADETPGSGGAQSLLLADGTRLAGLDAVVLALGHVRAEEPGAPDPRAAALGLAHFPPANPADLDLSGIAPGTPVLLRGLGLNFFDHMALFTLGRGGAFSRRPHGLRYHPSGLEPRLYAGSRRGVPYHARGENEKGVDGRHTPLLLTPERIAELTGRHREGPGLSFLRTLWPLIAREVECVYYGTLLASRGRAAERDAFVTAYLAGGDDTDRGGVLERFGIGPADRWCWERTASPHPRHGFTGPDGHRRWLLEHLAQDVRRARAGNVSDPHKAALDVLRDLRNEIRLVVDHGGLDGLSHRDDLDGWYTGLNAFLSIGPPASRIEEMAALIEAGVLDVVGPGLEVDIDEADAAFVARSPLVAGRPVRAHVLIEARLPVTDLRRTADPLLRDLLRSGQCRSYRIPAGRAPEGYETGGLEVTRRPYRLVDALGRAHPRRFAFGVPTEAVHWVTAAGARPGVNSVTLGDADAIAHAVASLTPAAAPRLPAYEDPGVRCPSDDRLTEVTA